MAMTMSLMIGMFLGSIPWLLAWARAARTTTELSGRKVAAKDLLEDLKQSHSRAIRRRR